MSFSGPLNYKPTISVEECQYHVTFGFSTRIGKYRCYTTDISFYRRSILCLICHWIIRRIKMTLRTLNDALVRHRQQIFVCLLWLFRESGFEMRHCMERGGYIELARAVKTIA